MNNHTVIIFPDTTPTSGMVTPLLPLFKRLVYLRPVENEPPANLPEDMAHLCGESGPCEFYTPEPLGDDRERFLRLVHDIRNRPAEYSAQLSALSLAELGSSETDRERTSSLMNTLFHSLSQEQPNDSQTKRKLLLWQSRLVLMLGEMLDKDKQELTGKLAGINQQEKTMYGELGSDFKPSVTPDSSVTKERERLFLRLKAWARLFAANPPKGPLTLITSSRDAMDCLTETFDSEPKEAPANDPLSPLTLYSLPGISPANLLLNAFGKEEDQKLLLDKGKEEHEPNAIIGFLKT